MPDPYTNPGEKPVNDGGGGTTPQPDPDTTEEQTTDSQVSQEGGSD